MCNKGLPLLRTAIQRISPGPGRSLPILAIILVVVLVAMTIAIPDRFLSTDNFQSMAFQLPEIGLLSMAMIVTLLSGGLNLSIITTANLSSVLMAVIMHRYIGSAGLSPLMVITAAILAGLACSTILGSINGTLIAYLEISPILATLGTMSLFEGLTLLITRGSAISGFPSQFLFLGRGTVLGVPVCLLIFLLFAFLMSLMLNRRPLGLSIYMVGSNVVATELSGINTKAVLFRTYVISGLFSGIAAVIMTSKYNSANAGYGSGYLLMTILVAVLGGIDPFGGKGKVSGLIVALVILQVISSGLNLLGVISFITISLWGAVIILVMWINMITGVRK